MELLDLNRVFAALIVVCLVAPPVAGQSPGETTTGIAPRAKTVADKPAASPEKPNAQGTNQPIVMQPIGVIRTPYKQAKGTPVQGVFGREVEAWVELKGQYVKGLKDLDGFSHAILLYYFHKSDREEIVTKPYLEGEEHGIFAIRSPNRPNHIGLSIVRIQRIEGGKLYFTEVDMLDGTPVLDIKPYVKQFDSRPDARSGWIERHYQNGSQPEVKTAR